MTERRCDPRGARAEVPPVLAHPYLAAEQGFIDDVIAPAQTRTVVAHAFRVLRSKHVQLPPKKHGNIPL